MTYTKLGQEFWDEIANARLSDAATRTHAEGIGYVYRIEAMNLRIPKEVVRRFAGSRDYEDGIRELVKGGFWADSDDVYVVVHHAEVIRQSLAAQIKKRREERDRLRAKRGTRTPRVGTNVGRDVGTNNPDFVGTNVGATQTDSQSGTSEDLKTRGKRNQQPTHANGSGVVTNLDWANRDAS